MRKPLSILALVALSWSQVAATRCEMAWPMGPGHGNGAPEAADRAGAPDAADPGPAPHDTTRGHRAAPGIGEDSDRPTPARHRPSSGDRDVHEDGSSRASCTLLMPCGFSAVGTSGLLPVLLPAARGVQAPPPPHAIDGRDLGADPPPPRARS